MSSALGSHEEKGHGFSSGDVLGDVIAEGTRAEHGPAERFAVVALPAGF